MAADALPCKNDTIGGTSYRLMGEISETKADISDDSEKVPDSGKGYKKLYEELQKEVTDLKKNEKVRLTQILLDSMPCVALLLRPITREIVASNKSAAGIGAVAGQQCYAAWFKRDDPCPWCKAPQLWETGQDAHLEVEDSGVVWDVHWLPVSEDLYMHYAFDITERKKAERERENLLRMIEAKNKELQSILYVTSHDLKSPLVNITGFTEELRSHCDELIEMTGKVEVCDEDKKRLGILLNDYIPESLGFIKKGAEQMRCLIDGLLQVSRAGSSELEIVKLDMNKLMAEVVGSIYFQAKEASVTISVDDLPVCFGDFAKTSQIFRNLVDNAIKYLDPARKGKIRISGDVEKGQSVYCVQDNGKGIAPEYQQRVFEIFHRLDPADQVKGEGLGLAIVMRIADRQGGRVWLESRPDKGSKFFVSLPATV